MINVKASVPKWSSYNEYRHNAIINNFFAYMVTLSRQCCRVPTYFVNWVKSLFVIVYFALLANCMHKNNLFIINLITCIVVKFCPLQSGSYLPKAISSSLNYFLFFLFYWVFSYSALQYWELGLESGRTRTLATLCCMLSSCFIIGEHAGLLVWLSTAELS